MSYHSSIYYDNYTYSNLSNNLFNSELTNINLYTKSIVGYKLGYLDNIYSDPVIITLYIPTYANTNINRNNIVDVSYSIFETNIAVPIQINDVSDNQNYEKCKNQNMDIKVGKIIEQDKLSFFLSKEYLLYQFNKRNTSNYTGTYTIYNDNGSIKCIEKYVNGLKSGQHTYVYENRNLEKKCNYVNGNLDGDYIEYYQNGNIKIKSHYTNATLNGEYIENYENGQNLVRCVFKNGVIDGEYIEWHNNGQIFKEVKYKLGKKEGEFKQWYYNGSMEVSTYFKNNVLHGIYRKFYMNNQLEIETNYINGECNGKTTTWYINSLMKTDCIYNNDIHPNNCRTR